MQIHFIKNEKIILLYFIFRVCVCVTHRYLAIKMSDLLVENTDTIRKKIIDYLK